MYSARRLVLLVVSAVILAVLLFWPRSGEPALIARPQQEASPVRAFSDQSEWTRLLPADAPLDPNSAKIVAEIVSWQSKTQWPTLSLGDFSTTQYWASDGDTIYNVVGPRPPEFRSLRIPAGAKPAAGSDSQMTVWDVDAGYVVGLWHASYNATTDTWKADNGDVYYLGSNGLDGKLLESDEDRNNGHRGYPSAIGAIRWDEVAAGVIPHVLKISVDKTAACHFYPGSGHESNRGGKLTCEGLILRLKADVDLSGLPLAAQVIAQAWKDYGLVIGDTGSKPMNIKLESELTTPAKWSTVGITAKVFKGHISLSDFEVIAAGYHRP